jgi:hypothetical protein
MPSTRLSRVVVATLALTAIACSDVTKPKASFPSTLGSYELYPLVGAPAHAATAISFTSGAVRADASFGFDVALDLDASGNPVVYPVRTVAGDLAGPMKRVGLQAVPGTFESVRDVPATGYDTLGAKTIVPGAVLAVELQEVIQCQYSAGGFYLYGKMVVDSVKPSPRRIFGRFVLDPNCGYRQVMPDTIPEF